MAEYLPSNNVEQITINDPKELMNSFLFMKSLEWIKRKLLRRLKDDIIIAEVDGENNLCYSKIVEN